MDLAGTVPGWLVQLLQLQRCPGRTSPVYMYVVHVCCPEGPGAYIVVGRMQENTLQPYALSHYTSIHARSMLPVLGGLA